MAHRDPVLALLARCAQLQRRLAELNEAELPQRARQALTRAESSRQLADALEARDALAARLVEAQRRRAVAAPDDSDDTLAFMVSGALDTAPATPPPPAKLGLAITLVCGAALGAVGLHAAWSPRSPAEPARAAPNQELRAYLVAVVTETHGAIQAGAHDHCTVDVLATPAARGALECTIALDCPGLERHVQGVCELTGEHGALRFQNSALDVDGARGVLTVFERDANGERGRAELRIVAR